MPSQGPAPNKSMNRPAQGLLHSDSEAVDNAAIGATAVAPPVIDKPFSGPNDDRKRIHHRTR